MAGPLFLFHLKPHKIMFVAIKRGEVPRQVIQNMLYVHPAWTITNEEVGFLVADFAAFLHIVWKAHFELSKGPDGRLIEVQIVVRVGEHRYFIRREEDYLRYGMVD